MNILKLPPCFEEDMIQKTRYPPYSSKDPKALADALGIRPEHRVLDVGGGHNPFFCADVVVDSEIYSAHHRDGSQIHIDSSEHYFVQADITSLPFPDKSFDVVICLHVLEHVLDPARACEELMRVARRGFLETPRKWTEFYAGYPTHLWLVDDSTGVLTFEPITFNSSPFMNFALPALWGSPELLKKYTGSCQDVPCVQLAWNDAFEYQVRDNHRVFWKKDSRSVVASRHYNFARNLLYWKVSPERGLYHAARATELCPKDIAYSKLYVFYLALSGKWKPAIKEGLTFKQGVVALFAYLSLGVSKRLDRWFRAVTNMFWSKNDSL